MAEAGIEALNRASLEDRTDSASTPPVVYAKQSIPVADETGPQQRGPTFSAVTQKPAESGRIYPCRKCGKLRTKAEGGTTFTVCDDCWDERPQKPAEPKWEEEIRARVRAVASELASGHNGRSCEPGQMIGWFEMFAARLLRADSNSGGETWD